MNHKDFDKIVKNRVDHCLKLLTEKSKEYSRDGDRLHNFKTAARITGKSKYEALYGMWMKHIVSVHDMIVDASRGIIISKKMIDEKLSDNINYTILLEALILEGSGTIK